MKFKKIPYVELIPIILISIVLYRVVNNIENIAGLVSKILSLISYFTWGFCIAYLLNPIMIFIEKRTKLSRLWSIVIVYTFFLGAISLVTTLLIPIIVKNIVDLISSMPNFITKAEGWIADYTTGNQFLIKHNVSAYIENNLNSLLKNADNYFGMVLKFLVTHLINFSSVLIKFVTGIVISIYLLKDKEVFILNIKRFMFITLGEKSATSTIYFGNKVNIIFKQFVLGKLIDSIIVGFLCFGALFILNIPYALIISIIIGITNMIPYFGNIIGVIPACLITLFYSPFQCLEVAVVILVLSQIDGLLLSPKILGDKIGLNPLWIILGIAIGGGLFGVIGMFLGVPTMAVIKTLLEEFIERRIKSLEK